MADGSSSWQCAEMPLIDFSCFTFFLFLLFPTLLRDGCFYLLLDFNLPLAASSKIHGSCADSCSHRPMDGRPLVNLNGPPKNASIWCVDRREGNRQGRPKGIRMDDDQALSG